MRFLRKLSVFCLIVWGFTQALCAVEQDEANAEPQVPPYVTCYLEGQLGNQLFKIATTLAYAWDYGAIPVFPDLNRSDYRLSENRDKIFFRLDPSSPPRPFSTQYVEIAWHSSEKIPFQRDQMLYGYYQSWKRFDHYRDRLLEVFAPSDALEESIQRKYGKLLAHPNTVSVHVRTFNAWLHNSKLHPFLGVDYYKRAFEQFPKDTLFVVFSDRVNWCKQHFAELGRQLVFIEGNDAVFDLYLMSRMKHHIMANSSFSWWGAYLNTSPEKRVIAPISMMHPDLYPFPLKQPNEFYLPDWVLVSPDYSAPYPFDMTWYDVTLSLDGN
jgi:Glycosyl transferase family 11